MLREGMRTSQLTLLDKAIERAGMLGLGTTSCPAVHHECALIENARAALSRLEDEEHPSRDGWPSLQKVCI